MTTPAEVSAFGFNKLAVGIITSFGATAIGLCEFQYSYTYPSGTMSGQSVTVKPITITVNSPPVDDGVITLPGGRVYSPWTEAGTRAPTGFATYTQRILYYGHVRPVQIEYRKLLALVGVTSFLNFEYGRAQTDVFFSAKQCHAMLMPITGIAERVMYPVNAPRTWVEITATWKQVTAFT